MRVRGAGEWEGPCDGARTPPGGYIMGEGERWGRAGRAGLGRTWRVHHGVGVEVLEHGLVGPGTVRSYD